MEHLGHTHYRESGFPFVAIRPFNVFGPDQPGEGAVKRFVVNALSAEPITIYNQGHQIRSWCYVSDVIRATELCLEHPEAPGRSFNIGHEGNTLTINTLAYKILDMTQSGSEVLRATGQGEDIALRVPNTTLAKEVLGMFIGIG